jgi:two-component sensor histidine kinase
MKADLHRQEAARLAALRRYDILDTPREADFDDVVEVLAAVCDAPISVINLIDADRQWFKAEVGLGVRETPLEPSICAHAILQPGLFVVPDTLRDPRFVDNCLVTGDPHLRFYAGALLESEEGLPLGTLCVLDYKPRELDDRQKRTIQLMARQVMRQIELRRALATERSARADAEELVEQNALLAREIDHRVKNSLQLVTSMLSLQARQSDNSEVKRWLAEAESRVRAVAAVHEQLYRAGQADKIVLGDFLQSLCRDVAETRPPNVDAVHCHAEPVTVRSDQAVSIGLMVNELIVNAYKHAFPPGRRGSIAVKGFGRGDDYCLEVRDDGAGLPADFDAVAGKGLGLRVLRALIDRLQGKMEIRRNQLGAEFEICFPLSA